MPAVEKPVRRSLALPARVAKRLGALAAVQRTSANRVLVDLIQAGLESESFSEMVDRLAPATDPRKRKQLKQELARMTFGE